MVWRNAHKIPPPAGAIVEIAGEDWIMPVKRKNYEQRPTNTKFYFKDHNIYWRWVYAGGILEGSSIDPKERSNKWRHIQDAEKAEGDVLCHSK